MRKLVSLALCVALLLCCTAVVVAEEAAEPVEIYFMTWSSEDAYMVPLVEAFNASQDRIVVNYTSETTNGEAYQTKLLTRLSSGEGVDVFGIYSPDLYTRYIELSALTSLDEMIAGGSINMEAYGTSVTSLMRNGAYYALPFRKSFDFMFYNKTLLEQSGVAIPEETTWDEFMQLCAKLTHVDADGSQYIGLLGCPLGWSTSGLIAMLAQYDEFVTDDELPHLKTCVQRIYDAFIGNPGTLSYAELVALGGPAMGATYTAGRTAFMVGGSYFIQILQSNPDLGFEWGIAYLPVDEGMKPRTAVGDLNMMGIASFTQHPQEAFEFLSYVCGAEGAKIIAANGMLPAYTSDEVLALLKSGKNATLAMEVLVNSSVITNYCGIEDMTDMNDMTTEEIQKMLIGEQSVEQTCENWNARRLEIVANLMK